MAEQDKQPATGPAAELADQVRARVAANAQQVQRTRRRVTRAMVQVRQADQRLRGEAADDPQWIGAVEHVTEVTRSELGATFGRSSCRNGRDRRGPMGTAERHRSRAGHGART